VLQKRVGGQHRVVRLNHSGANLGGWVDGETKLGLAAIVNGQALQKEGAQSRAGAATDSIEAEEALKTSAVICELADTIENKIHDLLADGVMATSIVVGGVLLARDELLWVVELTIGAGADLVNHGWLEI
jgi:hypothetical protein